MKLVKMLAAAAVMFSSVTFAADYGVELEWNTNDIGEVMSNMKEQRTEFAKLIDAGVIKDMYITDSQIDGKPLKLLRFVISADNEQAARDQLSHLPLYKKELVKISNIRNLGAKWLDNTPMSNNYGVILTWNHHVDSMEMDRVLGVDLARVIALNKSGYITSAYLNTQELAGGDIRPVYLISMLAKDAQQAKELSKQFEAVNLGYAKVEVTYLGQKLNMEELK